MLLKSTKPTVCILEFETYTGRNLIEVLKESNELVTFTHEDTVQTGSNTNTDYRYTGKDPNNYIKFNDELWRIIGIFNTDDGTGNYEEKVKIVRAKAAGSSYFANSGGTSNWKDSIIVNLLNTGDYYNRSGGYESIGLTNDSKEKIASVKWYLGGEDGPEHISEEFYTSERSKKVYNTNMSIDWIGKVGLMYVSDYGFATSDNCQNVKLTGDYGKCKDNNWIYNDGPNYDTFITPYSNNPNNVFYIFSTGMAYSNYEVGTVMPAFRPSLYLKSDISTSSGSGAQNNPYILN